MWVENAYRLACAYMCSGPVSTHDADDTCLHSGTVHGTQCMRLQVLLEFPVVAAPPADGWVPHPLISILN